MQELNVDHLVPIRKGGEDMLYNMYPSCRSCNQAKSTLDIEQFREFVQTAYQRAKQKPLFRIADAVGRANDSDKPVRFYFEQAFATADCKVKKLSKCELVDKLAYIAAKLDDVMMLEREKKK